MSISSISSFAKNAVSILGDSSKLPPVIMLEGTVTGGRTYQAYKRGGKTEALERVREESIAAFFWIFGVKMFNKIGDAIGKHVLKLPITDFDTGEDALRTPMKNAIESIRYKKPAEFLKGKARDAVINGREISDKALAGFKFGKIALSVLASISVIGIALPKFNQKLTANRLKKEKAEKDNKKNSNIIPSGIESFKQKIGASTAASGVAFAGSFLNTASYNLENHPIIRLLANDCGMLVGRTANARNKDERIEILFRDVASIYFYLRCREDIKNLLQNHTSGGKLTKLNPNCAGVVSDFMLKKAKESGGILNMDDFKGKISEGNKAVLAEFDERAKKEGSKIKDGVIDLDELKRFLPETLWEKAEKMSRLQPKQQLTRSVLTREQLEDVLSDGGMTNPEFLLDAYKKHFNKKKFFTKEVDDILTNDYKFISKKDINAFRSDLKEYVNAVSEYAAKRSSEVSDEIIKKGYSATDDLIKKGSVVTENIIKKANKASTMKSFGFFALGFAVSAAFLSTIIPKTQYLITKLRTGKNEFPGIEENEQKKA